MTTGDVLIAVGLGVNMLGVVLVFFVPKPEDEGHGLLLESAPPREVRDQRRRVRTWVAYGGLALLFIGFGLQLAGLLVDA